MADDHLLALRGLHGFAFSRPDRVPIPPGHAAVAPSTIIPPHSGERLDPNMAIWVALTNARIQAAKR